MCSRSPHEPDCISHSLQFNSQPIWPRMSQILAAVLDGLEPDHAHASDSQRAETGKLFLTANISNTPNQQLFQDMFQLFLTSIYLVRKRNSSVFLSKVNTVHLGRQYYINKDDTKSHFSLSTPKVGFLCSIFGDNAKQVQFQVLQKVSFQIQILRRNNRQW